MAQKIGAENLIDFTLLPQEYSPLTLAYIGDAVYEIYMRSRFVAEHNEKPSSLHRKVSRLVCASAQAKGYEIIKDLLSEEEERIFKRGRNAKSPTVPKNADVLEYRCATGVEALIGYLYIKKEYDRTDFLLCKIFEGICEVQ